MSLGDFHWGSAELLSPPENIIYYVAWLLIITIGNIIFLNFIIAEASASYESVKARLEEMILKERSDLINESQVMTPDWVKTEKTFPKYIIIRKIEE